ENRHTPEQDLFGTCQEIVAPIDRGTKRLVTRRIIPIANGENSQPFVKMSGYFVQSKSPHAGRRQFDGERNVVKLSTRFAHAHYVVGFEPQIGATRARTFDEELARFAGSE